MIATAQLIRGILAVSAVSAASAVPMAGATAPPDHDVAPVPDLRPGQVVTVAGGGDADDVPDGGDARDIAFYDDLEVDVGPDGRLYIITDWDERVWTVDPGGHARKLIRDDGSAPFLPGYRPQAVAVDEHGTLFLGGGFGVLRLEADGAYTTIGGTGDKDFADGGDGGDGGPATAASFYASDIATSAGTVYVADRKDGRVRRIDADGTITTVAGGGELGLKRSEGAPATQAQITNPRSVAADSAGNVYIVHEAARSDTEAFTVLRKVAPDGTISTLAGLNPVGFSGDGGPVTEARFETEIAGITVDAHDRLYVADSENGHVRRIDPDSTVTTVGPSLSSPDDVAIGPDGDLYVSIPGHVKRVALATGNDTLAGDCTVQPAEDAGETADPWVDEEPGTVVTLTAEPSGGTGQPGELVLDRPGSTTLHVGADGVLYVADGGRPQQVTPDGTVTPMAADPADGTPLKFVSAMATGADDVLYAAADGSILKLYPDGTIVVVGGSMLTEQPAADGLPATSLELRPAALACGPDEGLIVADRRSGRVIELGPDGTVTSVAGEFTDPDSGGRVNGIGVSQDGDIYVVAYSSAREGVYAIDAQGRSERVTGGDAAPLDEEIDEIDGERATDVELSLFNESDVAVDADGVIYVSTNGGIQRVDGGITTVLENPRGEYGGFSMPPPAAGLAFDPHGNLYFVDPAAERIRVLVRPGAVDNEESSFPWVPTGVGVGAVLILVAGAALILRRRQA